MELSVTLIIIVLTCISSILAFNNVQLREGAIFAPYTVLRQREWHRFITSGFIHADWLHLILNMYVLYAFGDMLEKHLLPIYFGGKSHLVFVILYLLALILSDIPTFIKYRNSPGYRSLGASGAVSAIVFAAIIISPFGFEMGLLFLPIMLPAIVFGTLYLLYTIYMSKRGGDNINHDAHFYGAVCGLIFPCILDPQIALDFFQQISDRI